MSREVRDFFRNCPVSEYRYSSRTANQLIRGGIQDMATLCGLLAREPEKLLGLRNIGPLGMEVIRRACASYEEEQSGGP